MTIKDNIEHKNKGNAQITFNGRRKELEVSFV